MEHLLIRFAADAAPLSADRATVQFYSTCAGGLPAAAEEWDLSQLLLLEGQSVQRGTVVCWLNAISQHAYGTPMFDEQPDSPAHTMAGLAQLLTFADAVGSSRGILLALDAQVSAAPLVAEVQVGEQQLKLAAGCCYYIDEMGSEPWALYSVGPSSHDKVADVRSAAVKEDLRQQYIQQVEALLYLAYKLKLPQLQRVVRQCISCNSRSPNSLLNTADHLCSVVSARVAEAAAGCGAAQAALIASSSNQLLAFSSSKGRQQVLKPLDLSAEQKRPIRFKAQVLEDLLCFGEGQIVDVDLDLFGACMWLSLAGQTPSLPLRLDVSLSVGGQLQLGS